MFNFAGGEKKTSKEISKEIKKDMRVESRELDRENARLEREVKRVEGEIRKTAKAGNMAGAKKLAKELINIKKTQERLLGMKGELSSVGMKASTMAATSTIVTSMATATKAISTSNKNAAGMMATMRDYSMATEKMNMTSEMMEDAIDMFDGSEDEEEADLITKQVLDEIGVDLAAKMVDAPTTRVKVKDSTPAEREDAEADALLKQLKLA